MIALANHTALLLFTRTANEEAKYKQLLNGSFSKQNKHLIEGLIKRSVLVARQSRLPLYIHTEEQQTGSTFGERLANAIEAVYDAGYAKVVVIGNDCLQLTTSEIQSAAAFINHNTSVLAPTEAGGVYLIGIHKDCFNRERFVNLHWGSSNIFTELKKLLTSHSYKLNVFRIKGDINDYKSLLKEIKLVDQIDTFRINATSILASVHQFLKEVIQLFQTYLQRYVVGLRAPPVKR